jgi:hypothetical protein
MPRFCEQSGRFALEPTSRDAGGTVSFSVATRERVADAVSRALRAALGWFGATVCCGIAFDSGLLAEGFGEGLDAGGGAEGCGDSVG